MGRFSFLAVLLAAVIPVQAAQLYRWVDEKGNVEYRDTPPPSSAKKAEERRITGSVVQSTPSYAEMQARRNFPVTLWAFDCGDPCTQARAHLARRGVPYTEKDPKADLKAYEKLTGSTNVPVLYVGPNKLTGYLESEWDRALDVAGYPRTASPAAKAAPRPAPPAAKPEAAKPAPAAEAPKPAPQSAARAAPPAAAK